MKKKIHLITAILATLCIATFFVSTILVELFGSEASIAVLKKLIVTPGLFILIPAMALTGGTGFASAKNRKGGLISSKKKRMPFIAANGLLVLTPCAIFLSLWASNDSFDSKFYIVQLIELFSGATNLTLMGMNMRDGLRMTGKWRRSSASQSAI